VGRPQHTVARDWLVERLNGTVRFGLPWVSLIAFIRIVTNPRIFARPSSVASAWQRVEEWLDCDPVWIPEPSQRHRAILAGLIAHAGAGGNLIHDAHLAALAIEHGLTLASADGDLARFPGLRWNNPLRERTAT